MLPRHAAKANAGSPKPSEITNQQRLEKLGQLAIIFVCIFGSLTPEQQAQYEPQVMEQIAA